ncbi:MAG: class I SAM-dependent methyltransferase, partial [Gloeobacteraceae cyanobacterium ES-bin-144]|nr:class I SAM-dependent methyltransferase [Verrucomicrobiales bacterium]
FWTDKKKTEKWFASFELENITHYKMTTQEFVRSDVYRDLNHVDILFVDGFHSEEQARQDHEAFLEKMNENAIAFFHDSVTERNSRMYGAEKIYQYGVCRYLDQLKTDARFQVFDFPFTDGLTLVRKNTGRKIFDPRKLDPQP